jgi:hypothetical protein
VRKKGKFLARNIADDIKELAALNSIDTELWMVPSFAPSDQVDTILAPCFDTSEDGHDGVVSATFEKSQPSSFSNLQAKD